MDFSCFGVDGEQHICSIKITIEILSTFYFQIRTKVKEVRNCFRQALYGKSDKESLLQVRKSLALCIPCSIMLAVHWARVQELLDKFLMLYVGFLCIFDTPLWRFLDVSARRAGHGVGFLFIHFGIRMFFCVTIALE